MATTVDNLSVKWGADFRELLAEYKKGEAASAQFRQKISKEMDGAKQAFDRIGGEIRNALTRLAAGVGLAGLTRMGREAMKAAEDLQQTSRWLGVGVEKLQAWEFAAREAGIEQGKLTASLDKMRGNLADFAADPSSNGAQIFRQLGISLRDSTGQLRTLDSIIPELARKISTLGTGDKLLVGKTLFGDKNDDVVRFFDSIAGRFAEIENRAKAAGQVYNKEFVESTAKLNREIGLLEDKIGKDLKQAVIDFAPAWKFALEAVVEVQLAVDKLLSSVRIGSFRLGPQVSATERLGELDRDIAAAERKAATAQTRRPGAFGIGAARGPEEAGKLQQDLARLRQERASILNRVDAESAARLGPASSIEQEALLAGITPTGKKPDRLRTGGEDEFAKKIREMQREAKALRDELDFGPAAASFNKLTAEFEAGNGKIRPSKVQVEQFKEALRKIEDGKAALAFKDLGTQNERLAQIVAAEVSGNRELVAILEQRFALEDRLGRKLTEAELARAEALARTRFQMEQARERARAALQELESLVEGFASSAMSEMNAFFDGQKTGWEALRDFARKALQDIANELFKLGVMNPLLNALLGGNRPGLGDLGGVLGGLLGNGSSSSSAVSLIGGIGGIAGIPGLAEGGPVAPRMPHMVGERGPELFVPSVPGTIVPNHKLGGGAVTYIDARGADQAAIARLEQIVRAQGSELRRWQAGEPARVVGHVVDAKRRGGAAASVFG